MSFQFELLIVLFVRLVVGYRLGFVQYFRYLLSHQVPTQHLKAHQYLSLIAARHLVYCLLMYVLHQTRLTSLVKSLSSLYFAYFHQVGFAASFSDKR